LEDIRTLTDSEKFSYKKITPKRCKALKKESNAQCPWAVTLFLSYTEKTKTNIYNHIIRKAFGKFHIDVSCMLTFHVFCKTIASFMSAVTIHFYRNKVDYHWNSYYKHKHDIQNLFIEHDIDDYSRQ